MKFKNLNKIIVLIALILVSSLSLLQNFSMTQFAISMSIALIVFLILGTIIQNFINKLISQADETKKKEDELKSAEEQEKSSQK